jgi:hypothetical protein
MVAVRRKDRSRVISGLARKHGWTMGAELGVFSGKTFLYLLEACPDLNMIGVDTWEPAPDTVEKAPGGRSYASHDLDGYYERLKRDLVPYGGRAALLRMPTVEAASKFPDGHFDFVFIDADHRVEGVSADILAWGPKVSETGWIMGHDFQRKFPGVIQSVREMLPRYQLFSDSVWAVPKADTVFA